MSRDKQTEIEKMAKDLCGEIKYDVVEHYYSEDSRWSDVTFDYNKIAENIYNKGYVKASDVAEEIFDDIERLLFANRFFTLEGAYYHKELKDCLAELKKKYIGKDTNVTTKTEGGE